MWMIGTEMSPLCAGSDKMNKGMVEWTNMSVINRPIKNSKIGVETMSTLGKCKINFNNP